MYGYFSYESVADKKAKALKILNKLKKKNPNISPVVIQGKLASSWWGKAWINNLERYADYANRIGRGRSYVKNGMVLDLQIVRGQISALVCGSTMKPYEIEIKIDPLSKKNMEELTKLCSNRIDTMEALVAGKFTKELESLLFAKKTGLFPSPNEIHFSCSCPDWAYMCKHVAAVLYGVGARLDADPLLFFTLRDIDSEQFIKKSVEKKTELMLKNAGKKSSRSIDEKDINGIFGI